MVAKGRSIPCSAGWSVTAWWRQGGRRATEDRRASTTASLHEGERPLRPASREWKPRDAVDGVSAWWRWRWRCSRHEL